MKNNLLIFGFGYTASELAKKSLQNKNWNIIGTTRKASTIQNLHYNIINFDPHSVLGVIKQVTHILVSTPPDLNNGDPVLPDFAKIIADNSLHIKWLGYLSTTGVYGDHKGNWIDESTLAHPENKRAKARLLAEQNWLQFGLNNQIPTHIFRLAGIYGPGRNVLIELRANKARSVYKKDHVFSRIHVEDIANILFASMQNPKGREIYNICDDEPAPSHEVIKYAANLLKIRPPEVIPYEQAALSQIAQEFYSSNKRIRNDKIKNLLQIELKYPTYREGLKSLL